MLNKIISFFALLFVSLSGLAQADTESSLSKTFHESGKINVVIAIICVIFIGIVIFLIRTDQKIKKLEDQIGNK